MSKITDYSFLFHSMFGTKSTKGASAIGSFQLSQLNSSSVQAQLRAAGIDTNSKQYKAAIKQMMSNANGAMPVSWPPRWVPLPLRCGRTSTASAT